MEQGTESMTAKQYLMQVREAKVKIEQKRQELQELRETAGIREQPDGERVLSSSAQEGCANVAIRIVHLEREIERRIVEYCERKDRIIEMIHSMGNYQYIEVLFRRYIRFEPFEVIAVGIGYTFRHTTRLHGEALLEFQKVMEKMS